jgi:hypothetical protein
MEFNDYYMDSYAAQIRSRTTLGVAQVSMDTAKQMEDMGYMPKLSEYKDSSILGFLGDETGMRIRALSDPETCIRYAAAYLRYFQDRWKQYYPEIDGRTAVLATLYNQGENHPPHSNPVPNAFGEFARDNYWHVRELMEINN